MSEELLNTIVILFFTVFPLLLILLQVYLSTRKRILWGFIVPILWTISGVWIIQSRFSYEMLIFFAGGEFILLGILALLRYLKGRRKK